MKNNKLSICAILLCRGGSHGIPRKNIKLLNGKPLMSYAIQELKKLSYPIYVSTDDQEIAEVARGLGVEVIDRPAELASDTAKSIDAVKHALSIVDADYVLLANACTPFVKAEDYEGAVKLMLRTKADSVVSLVQDFSAHPSKTCNLLGGGRIIKVGKHPYRENCAGCEWCETEKDKGWFWTGERQNLNPCFKRNTAIYLAKREVIESGTFFGPDTRGYVMPVERSLDLNTLWDWKLAELILQNENK